MKLQAMLYFTLSKIVQIRLPMPVLSKIVGNMFGHENVPCVAAIEHALGDIDSSARDINAIIHVRDLINRTTVNSHPNLKSRRGAQFLCDLQGTAHRLFEVFEKQQRHAIAHGQSDEFIFRFSRAETFRLADDAI